MTSTTNFDYKTKTTYAIEDPEVITARSALAKFHMSQGKSFKHSWWMAFQQYPRPTLPNPTENPSTTQSDGSTACTDEGSQGL